MWAWCKGWHCNCVWQLLLQRWTPEHGSHALIAAAVIDDDWVMFDYQHACSSVSTVSITPSRTCDIAYATAVAYDAKKDLICRRCRKFVSYQSAIVAATSYCNAIGNWLRFSHRGYIFEFVICGNWIWKRKEHHDVFLISMSIIGRK